MKFHFIMVAWGDAYIEMLLKFAVPALLSPNNLPAFCAKYESIFKLYTNPEDEEAVRASAVFQKLASIVEPEIYPLQTADSPNKYHVQAQCHFHAIEEAKRDDAALIFLAPDAVFSDGSFRSLARIAGLGKRQVMVPGLRVAKETFAPEIERRFFDREKLALSLPPRELAKCAIGNLHPLSKKFCWSAQKISCWPAHLYWPVGNEGILARCFHLHPLMIDVWGKGERIGQRALPSHSGTIDGDFLNNLGVAPDDYCVVEDSDDILVCEISASNLFDDFKTIRPARWSVAIWAKQNSSLLHREYFKRRIRIHSEDIASNWDAVEQDSDKIVGSVMFLLKFGEPFLFNWRTAWLAAKGIPIRLLAMAGVGKLYKKIKAKLTDRH